MIFQTTRIASAFATDPCELITCDCCKSLLGVRGALLSDGRITCDRCTSREARAEITGWTLLSTVRGVLMGRRVHTASLVDTDRRHIYSASYERDGGTEWLVVDHRRIMRRPVFTSGAWECC